MTSGRRLEDDAIAQKDIKNVRRLLLLAILGKFLTPFRCSCNRIIAWSRDLDLRRG
jgi:hypothetical protein